MYDEVSIEEFIQDEDDEYIYVSHNGRFYVYPKVKEEENVLQRDTVVDESDK